MAGLVILIVILIMLSRVNPYLTAIAISGAIGYALASFFVKYGAPAWVIPTGTILWICAATPGITGFLMTIIPPRKRK